MLGEYNYLDHYDMVRVFTGFIQDSIARDHVINYITFRDLFRTKCLRGREVHPVIVAQVVVAHNRGRLQYSNDIVISRKETKDIVGSLSFKNH